MPADRARFRALPVAPYDRAWRFELAIEPAFDARHLEVVTGTDGVVAPERLGHVTIADVGTLDVWRHTGYGGGLLPAVPGRVGTRRAPTTRPGRAPSHRPGTWLPPASRGANATMATDPGKISCI